MGKPGVTKVTAVGVRKQQPGGVRQEGEGRREEGRGMGGVSPLRGGVTQGLLVVLAMEIKNPLLPCLPFFFFFLQWMLEYVSFAC